jgi:hypothetical protein
MTHTSVDGEGEVERDGSESIDEALGENETGAAALNALADFLDEPTIGRVHGWSTGWRRTGISCGRGR